MFCVWVIYLSYLSVATAQVGLYLSSCILIFPTLMSSFRLCLPFSSFLFLYLFFPIDCVLLFSHFSSTILSSYLLSPTLQSPPQTVLFLIFYQLAVGPVAIVSLLTGTLIAKWQPDYATNNVGAMDTAAQASLCTGIVSTSSRRTFYSHSCIWSIFCIDVCCAIFVTQFYFIFMESTIMYGSLHLFIV